MNYFHSCVKCTKPFEIRSYCNECLDTLPRCEKCNLPNEQGGNMCNLCHSKDKVDFLILNECWGKNYAYIGADRLIQLANQAKIKNNFEEIEK